MHFFDRVKKLLVALYAIDFVATVGLTIYLLENGFSDFSLNPEKHILFFVAVGVFVVLLIITLALRCIQKDAQDDFTAILNYYNNNSKTGE